MELVDVDEGDDEGKRREEPDRGDRDAGPITSTGTAAQYAAPRNAAVMKGDLISHAKYAAVCSENTVSWKPARKTRRLAAYRRYRIHFVSGRRPGAGDGTTMWNLEVGRDWVLRRMQRDARSSLGHIRKV
ncbi:MAG: hypothetical protein E6K17_03880 [Methanobacteriota archaeon]|nr:MAG: hypothetical protein E6K17_03880 [Euryarchaeota archaeon]